MSITLCRGDLGRSHHNCACPWRHDDRSACVRLGNGLADSVLIVASVDSEGSNWIDELIEQRVDCSIIDIFLGHFDAADLATDGMNTDVQLRPRSAARRAVLLKQPFADAVEFQAVLSISKCRGSVLTRWSGGTSNVFGRRLKVEWSGTARSGPNNPRTEQIRTPVCRSAKPNTMRIVRAVVIASVEQCPWPPGLVRGSARYAAIVSSVNHTAKLPRFLNEASYSDQFVTRYLGSGMW